MDTWLLLDKEVFNHTTPEVLRLLQPWLVGIGSPRAHGFGHMLLHILSTSHGYGEKDGSA
jgi:hypothetical protein